jgi:diguanylate cyclase (GGDEF)-like protein
MDKIQEAIKKLQSIAKEQPGMLELLDNLVDNNLNAKKDLHSITGAAFMDLFPEEAHKELKAMLRKAGRGRNYCFDYEYRLDSNTTKYVTFHCFKFSILTENYLFVQCQDNTEEHKAKLNAKEYLNDLKLANAKLLELSVTDELTGLYNIRYFNERIVDEHDKAKRYEYPYSILFIDVDYFKKFNDAHGHLCGDQVLAQLSSRIGSFVRKSDVVARYGGEEFIVLCPHTNVAKGRETAHRLREFIEKTIFNLPGHDERKPGLITVSIGVSSFPVHSNNSSELINMSDSAMYNAKGSGRNCISVYDPDKKKRKSTG